MEICSYCQRPYGLKSINKLPIYKTIDHIQPLNKGIKERQPSERGMSALKQFLLEHDRLTNLIECCNECNVLKNNYYPRVFKYKLNHQKFIKSSSGRYLTKDLIKTIKNSIDVMLKNESEPIEIQIYTFDLII